MPTAVLSQQRRSAPQDRRLAVQVAGVAGAVQVILQIVFLVGAFAYVGDVAVFVDIAHQAEPALARRRDISLFVEPSVFDPGNHGEGEHAGG